MTTTAFITGASGGIGAATAVALARIGIAPVLAVRDTASASHTEGAVRQLGMRCHIVECDVADAVSVSSAIARAHQIHGRLDIVVNNAGQVDPIGHVVDTDPIQWAHAISVNLTGAYFVVQAALPHLLQTGGVIINLSSGAAHAPQEGWSAYCSAKAGLAMLTRCLAQEYTASGILVYGLRPGLVNTKMQGRVRLSGMNEVSRISKDLLAPPDYPAKLIAWLAREHPSDLSGQDLSIGDASLLARAGIAT